MKKLSLFCFTLFAVLIFCEVGFSQQPVTSKELSVADIEKTVIQLVQPTIRTPKAIETLKVIGVQQDGNSAEAYYTFETTGPGGGLNVRTMKLVRFTSGHWYFPGNGIFLIK